MVFKQYIRHYIIYFIVMALGSRILLLVGELLNTYHSQNLQLCLALLFILSWLMTTVLIVCIHRFSNNKYDQIFKMILGCVFLFHITQQLTFMDPPINHEPSINLETVFFIDVLTQVVYLALGSRLSALRPSFYLPAIGVIVLLFFYHWLWDNRHTKSFWKIIFILIFIFRSSSVWLLVLYIMRQAGSMTKKVCF